MKIHYLLIAEEGTINLETAFFKVAVSQSKQGQRDLVFLRHWSREHNFYLERVSAESDQFLWMIANSLVPAETTLPLSVLNIQMIDAHTMVQDITQHKSFKAHSHATCNVFTTRYMLDTDFRARENIAKR